MENEKEREVKMEGLRTYQVYDEQYKQLIHLLIGDVESAQDYIMKLEKTDHIPEPVCKTFDESEGVCINVCNMEILIWMRSFSPSPESISILVHEVLHALTYRASRCHTTPHLIHDNLYWVEMVVRKFLEQLLPSK